MLVRAIFLFCAAFVFSTFVFASASRPLAFLCKTVFDPINVPGFNSQNPVFINQDTRNWHRDFGAKFFFNSDPLWRDPAYLEAFAKLAQPQLTTYYGRPAELLYEVQNRMRKLGHGSILTFTTTGTEANNLMLRTALENPNLRKASTKSPVILSFVNLYGGSYGLSKTLSHGEVFLIPAPLVSTSEVKYLPQSSELNIAERESIDRILEYAKTENVAGIFIEPFPIKSRGQLFRPVYLAKLRQVADQLQIPILADEILSGGGRTGYFWSYQSHPYYNFEPDLVTFGKGLVLSGVFQPERRNTRTPFRDYVYGAFMQHPRVTLEAHPVAMLQAIQVLKALDEGKVMQHVRKIGEHLSQRMLELDRQQGTQYPSNVHGTILVSFWNLWAQGVPRALVPRQAHGRYNLPYTITLDQIDVFFGKKPFIYEGDPLNWD